MRRIACDASHAAPNVLLTRPSRSESTIQESAMRGLIEVVLHHAILAPICALVGSIALLCLACGVLSKFGDRLAGERPWRQSGSNELQVA
jgi:hypothetical protein